MGNSQIRELLGKLQEEIRKTDLDDDTRSLVRDLDADIHDLLDPEEHETDRDSVVEKARALETSFASEHPTIERFVREVIDALVRMGI
ncbi:MAG: DUF4404 family protein [Woeseiaceae bacterium]|nr:DUF4404 family protein [Woeseiaceae bacterium]